MAEAQKEMDGALSHQLDKLEINASDAPSVKTSSPKDSTVTKPDVSPKKKRKKPRKSVASTSVDKEYEVEEILDKKIGVDGVTSYKILWLGYPREQASWVVREHMDCPDKMDEFDKKDRSARYRKRSNIFEENWQELSTGVEKASEGTTEMMPGGLVKSEAEPEIKMECTKGAVTTTESQLLAEYLALLDEGIEVVDNVPSWKQSLQSRKSLPEKKPIKALKAVEDGNGELFLEMEWDDGVTMKVPFPVALKLYPMIFLPWFESYLNAEAAKEGCGREDFLDVDWEVKLTKYKEDSEAENMDVDEPPSAESERHVPMSHDPHGPHPPNLGPEVSKVDATTTQAIVDGHQLTAVSETTVSPRARLLLKLPRLLPKSIQQIPSTSGPNSPAFLSNDKDLLMIQDSIRTPPVPPSTNPSIPLTVAAANTPLASATTQSIAPEVTAAVLPSTVSVQAAMSIQQPLPVGGFLTSHHPAFTEDIPASLQTVQKAAPAEVRVERVMILPANTPIITPMDILLAASPSPQRSPRPPKLGDSTPKRSGRPRKQPNSSPPRPTPPRNILPKPLPGTGSGTEGSALVIPELPSTASQLSASHNSSLSSPTETASDFHQSNDVGAPGRPASASKEPAVTPEVTQSATENPTVDSSSSAAASVASNAAPPSKTHSVGSTPPEDEKPKIPKAEDEDKYREKRELYLRYLPLLNRCIAKLTTDLAEKEQEVATLDTLLKERPEAREASQTINVRKDTLKTEIDTIKHPLKRLVLLVTAGKDQPTLRVLEKCVNVVERSKPWFENYIGEAEAEKYFPNFSSTAASNPASPMSAPSNNSSLQASTSAPNTSPQGVPNTSPQRTNQPSVDRSNKLPSEAMFDRGSFSSTFGKNRAPGPSPKTQQPHSPHKSNLINIPLTETQGPPKYTGYSPRPPQQPQGLLLTPTDSSLGALIQSVISSYPGSRPTQPLSRYTGPSVPPLPVRQLIGSPQRVSLPQPPIAIQRPLLLPRGEHTQVSGMIRPGTAWKTVTRPLTRPTLRTPPTFTPMPPPSNLPKE